MRFKDRDEAGRLLAHKLASYKDQDIVVYALPRGGVVLGAEVAKALKAPLGVIIPRKIGHAFNPEYAIGAVTEAGHTVWNEAERDLADPAWLAAEVSRQQQEAARRHQLYKTPQLDPASKTAIIVDDGIATGLTMRAAIQGLASQQPKHIVVAVPVIPKNTAELLKTMDAKVIALEVTDDFLGAVAGYYQDFPQVEDKEVIQLLQKTNRGR